MADFGFFSDTDDSAVEEVISRAKDLSVLEQISAINCSGFTDSVIPTELEQRFLKLKSFPATKPTTPNDAHSKIELKGSKSESEIFLNSKLQNPETKMGFGGEVPSSSPLNSSVFSDSKQNPDGKLNSKGVSASSSPDSSIENLIFSPSEHFKSKSKSVFSQLNSFDSPSPPQKASCFWCSPKKFWKKKSMENRFVGSDLDWSKNNEFISDLATLSVKELKKAMREEQKVSEETEKIVKWAMQVSKRMSVHDDIEDELSDD